VIEIGRTEAHGGHRQLACVVLDHGDDLGVGTDVEDLAQQLQTLRRHGRLALRAQVEQHRIRLGATHGDQRLIGGLAGGHVQIGEHRFQLPSQGAIVREDQQLATLHRDGHQRAPLPSRTPRRLDQDGQIKQQVVVLDVVQVVLQLLERILLG